MAPDQQSFPLMTRAAWLFYRMDGPWRRRGLAEALGSRRYSHPALFGMDRRLAELMPWRGGTFLEAGAADGYMQSNTYFLERFRGWSGVLVEPVPELRAKCERRRPGAHVAGCALVAPEQAGSEVTIHYGDLMSTLGDPEHASGGLRVVGRQPYSVSVPARTLSSVIDEAGLERIDLMSLDLEGHELEALAGLDLDRHAPRYLLVEALDLEAQRPSFERLLGERYDLSEELSHYDLLFRRRDDRGA